jgi:cbb3-type cytochrome oxidase subunit 3
MEAEEEEEEEEKGGDVDDISFFLVVLPVTNEAHTNNARGVDEIQTFLLFLCVYVYAIYINHAGERKTRDEESTLFSLCVCV